MKPGGKQDIMNAVERLFQDRRFHEVTLDDVAREARVSKGTIYRFFRNKEELVFETAMAGFDELCELLDRLEPETTDFPELLHHACDRIIQFFASRRQLFRIMSSEESRVLSVHGECRQQWLKRRSRMVAALTSLLQGGMDQGFVRTDISGDILAIYLLGMLKTRTQELADVPPDMGSLDTLLDIFWKGVRAGASGSPGK